MEKVYISGALTNVTKPRIKAFYEMQAKVCERFGMQPYIPHKESDPIKHAHLPAEKVYEMDRYHVSTSQLIIANATIPSFGVGQEIEIANQYNIPIILLCDKTMPLSRMVRGNPGITYIIFYESIEDALVQLAVFLCQSFNKLHLTTDS